VFDLALHRNLQHRSAEARIVAVLLVVVHRTWASPYPERLGWGSPLWRRGEAARSIGAAHPCFGIVVGVPPMCRPGAVCIARWVRWVRTGFAFGKR
jgi:hypothetical protein